MISFVEEILNQLGRGMRELTPTHLELKIAKINAQIENEKTRMEGNLK